MLLSEDNYNMCVCFSFAGAEFPKVTLDIF